MQATLDIQDLKNPELFGDLERKVTATRPLMATWAQAVSRQAQRNARAKGGQFWTDLGKAVQVREVSDRHAVVACGAPGSEIGRIGAHKQFGGPVEHPTGGRLAIPVPGSPAKGKRARGDFGKLFVVKGEKNALLGRNRGGKFEALFTLVRKTKPQRAFPWWPSGVDILRLGAKEAAFWLKRN